MLDPSQVPAITSDEILARFIIFSRHIRSSNMTVKPDAFIPHPLIKLSVTRHREATEHELWQEGERVAQIRGATQYGRADVITRAFENEELSLAATLIIPENPNHGDVIGWPGEKPAQKMKAVEIARKSQYLPKPG